MSAGVCMCVYRASEFNVGGASGDVGGRGQRSGMRI